MTPEMLYSKQSLSTSAQAVRVPVPSSSLSSRTHPPASRTYPQSSRTHPPTTRTHPPTSRTHPSTSHTHSSTSRPVGPVDLRTEPGRLVPIHLSRLPSSSSSSSSLPSFGSILEYLEQQPSDHQHPTTVPPPSPSSSSSLPSFGSILEHLQQQPPQQPHPVPVSSSSSFPGACESRQVQRREPHIHSPDSSLPSFGSILEHIEQQQQQQQQPHQPHPVPVSSLSSSSSSSSSSSPSAPSACEPRQDQRRELHIPSPSSSSSLSSFSSIFEYIGNQQDASASPLQLCPKHAKQLRKKQLLQHQEPSVPSHSATGACESRQEQRRQKRAPRPTGCGHPCKKVKKFLPAHFCGHEVPPHKMKDGNRVVRIDDARARRNVAIVRAEAHAKAAAKAAQVASKRSPSPVPVPSPSTPQKDSTSLANPPPICHRHRDLPVTPTPASRRPLPAVMPVTPSPVRVGHAGSSADYDIQGFRNPDLNDKPLHFSPSMFKPEIDRHNFTWSSWDSRSTEFSMHEWESPVAPPNALDNLACKHPELLLRLRNALAGLPPPRPEEYLELSPVPAGSSVDSIHYDSVDGSSFFSSPSPSVVLSVRGRASFDTPLSSDWVLVDEEAWAPRHAMSINTMLARDWAGVKEGAQYRKYIRTLVQVGSADPPAESASVEARALHELWHHASHINVRSNPLGIYTLSLLHGPDVPLTPTTSTLSEHQPASVSASQHFRSLRQVPMAATTTTTTTAAAQPHTPPAVTTKKPSSLGWKSLSCIAVAATTVAAGLAYAWFSG